MASALDTNHHATTVEEVHSPDPTPKAVPEESWKNTETHSLPYNRFIVVFPSLMLCLFLAALDHTIVAIALPTIVAELGGGQHYSWVGTAYTLGDSAFGPLCGKLSDLVGRKPVIFSSIACFLIGSALCAAAQNMTWLIACRAIQGAGGGGIIQMVQIILTDIVSLQDRATYGGINGATWGIAGVVGPLLGGVLTDHISWRWCFWINLPTGGFAAALLFTFLNLNPHKGLTLQQHVRNFDFLGLFLLIGGVVCLSMGFTNSENSWNSVKTIVLICSGGVAIATASVWELYTSRSPIIPPRLFKMRTTAILLILTFFHSFSYFAAAYYLPLYYQVLGSSATGAGILLIPFSILTSVASVSSGFVLARIGRYRPIIWAAWFLMLLGFGLSTMLDGESNTAKKILYPLVTAIGIGSLFQVPLVPFVAAMPLKDMATSTTALLFVRNVGGSIGIAVGQAIISDVLRKKIRYIRGVDFDTSPKGLNQSVGKLKAILDPTIRKEVIHAYAQSITTIWIVMTPVVGVGLIMSFFLKESGLQADEKEATNCGDEKSSSSAELETEKPDR